MRAKCTKASLVTSAGQASKDNGRTVVWFKPQANSVPVIITWCQPLYFNVA